MALKAYLIPAALAAIVGIRSVDGAVVSFNPQAISYWSSEASFKNGDGGSPLSGADFVLGNSGVYEIGMYMSMSLSSADVAAGFTGFGDAAFDVQFSSGLSPSSTDPGYYGNPVTALASGNKVLYTDALGVQHIDGTGNGGTVQLFFINGDSGASDTDLKFITLDLGGGTFGSADPRVHLGQATQNQHLTKLLGNPVQVGVIFVDYSALSDFGATLSLTQSAGEGFGLRNNTTGKEVFQNQGAGETYNLGSLSFFPADDEGGVPEPTSLALAGLSVGLVAVMRKRGGGARLGLEANHSTPDGAS